MRNYLYRLLKSLFIINCMILSAIGIVIAKPVVVLNFADSATVNDTAIFLRDIATISTDLPEVKQRMSVVMVGEIAPPGYARFINTADLLLYRLQPAFKDVDLKAAENKRIVVKTTGVIRKIDDYANIVDGYLREHLGWKPGDWRFIIENGGDTWKTLDLPMSVSVAGALEREKPPAIYQRGHIQLQFAINQRDRISRIPVSCYIKISTPVVVAKCAIERGKVIDCNDVEMEKVDLSGFGPDPYFTIEELLGQKALRNINRGSIVFNKLLAPVPIISKGDQVAIKVAQGSVRISILAIARENGNVGQKIWVENATTHKLLRVTVKDKTSAVVL